MPSQKSTAVNKHQIAKFIIQFAKAPFFNCLYFSSFSIKLSSGLNTSNTNNQQQKTLYAVTTFHITRQFISLIKITCILVQSLQTGLFSQL